VHPYPNLLRRGLAAGEFVASVEYVTPEVSEPFETAIAPIVDLAEHIKADPRFHTLAITDRVKSDHDHDPVRVAEHVAAACGKAPTVHLSGKDRDGRWLTDALRRMRAAGLENVLMVTGDKVKHPPRDRAVRYLDSVNMVAEARSSGEFHIAAAVSPFKYREEELLNQYLKMVKKERAGADYFITQIGWDMLKFKELLAYRRRRGLRAPVMAGVMLLTAARARYVRTTGVAGIVITDRLYARLEEEAKQPDKGIGAAYRRLALQIVGLKRLGLAGFQLTGLHSFEKLDGLFRQIEGLDQGLRSEGAWWDAWWRALGGPDQAPQLAPERSFYLFEELGQPGGWAVPIDQLTLRELGADAVTREVRKFRWLDRLDRLVFKEGSPGDTVLGPLARRVPRGSAPDRALHWLERRIKKPIVGCQTCGFCRLPYTAYVCPETCPKGLANGPCGGTRENLCEFGDRECIHSRKYRIAKAAGRLHELEELLIPAVDATTRSTCSWTNHFRGDDPAVCVLPEIRKKGNLA
jgi:methylenetetrahydrofolate reductase (NADPH)